MRSEVLTTEWCLRPGHEVVDALSFDVVPHASASFSTLQALGRRELGVVRALVAHEEAPFGVQDGVREQVDSPLVVARPLTLALCKIRYTERKE